MSIDILSPFVGSTKTVFGNRNRLLELPSQHRKEARLSKQKYGKSDRCLRIKWISENPKETQLRFYVISIVNKDTVSSQQDSPRIAVHRAIGGPEVMEKLNLRQGRPTMVTPERERKV